MEEAGSTTQAAAGLTAGERLIADFEKLAASFIAADRQRTKASIIESGLLPYLIHPVTEAPLYTACHEIPEDIRQSLANSSLDLFIAQRNARRADQEAYALTRELSAKDRELRGKEFEVTALSPGSLPIYAINRVGENYKQLDNVRGTFTFTKPDEGLIYLKPSGLRFRKASHFLVKVLDSTTHKPAVSITVID